MDAIEALNIWADKITQRDARIAALEAELAALKAKRALLVAEVDVTRAFMDAAEDSSWPNAWADYGEYVTVAQAATDAAKAREGA